MPATERIVHFQHRSPAHLAKAVARFSATGGGHQWPVLTSAYDPKRNIAPDTSPRPESKRYPAERSDSDDDERRRMPYDKKYKPN